MISSNIMAKILQYLWCQHPLSQKEIPSAHLTDTPCPSKAAKAGENQDSWLASLTGTFDFFWETHHFGEDNANALTILTDVSLASPS